jgi:ADP-ribosyl-[dinitrogen reductase] hydrolase
LASNYVLDGLMGFCVGDALGVPVEFVSREKLKKFPVTDMRGFGTHGQIAGTWSDDSSMTFCLAESLINGLDYVDAADRFCKWLSEGYWTPSNKTFGVGRTTLGALSSIKKGVKAVEAGGKSEKDNGNGSLMRILPIAFYLNKNDYEDRFEIIHNVSSITHGHLRCQIACSIYVQYAVNLIRGFDKKESYGLMQRDIFNNYNESFYKHEIKLFNRILCEDISNCNVDEINSSDYVVDTLEAALWCFINSDSYRESILKAVNLGQDTDTVAAITGGLSGLYYGLEAIPVDWLDKIPRKNDIYELADNLYNSLEKSS